MEASELCDGLKKKVASLEEQLSAVSEHRRVVRNDLTDYMRALRHVAEHLGVEKVGSCSELEHRIWVAVNDLRRAAKGITESEKLQQELRVVREDRQAAIDSREKKIDGLVCQLREVSDELESSRRQARSAACELKDYHVKYQALDKAADEACIFAGLDRSGEGIVQDVVLDSLDRLSKACVADTTDTRIKRLEQVCYGAESRSGVSCREINPWRRIEYVLNTMAAELAHLRVTGKVPEAVRKKVWAIQRNLGAEVSDHTHSHHRDETEEVINVLKAIENTAMDAQNVRAACLKLKELL
jgi:hypothetical protein